MSRPTSRLALPSVLLAAIAVSNCDGGTPTAPNGQPQRPPPAFNVGANGCVAPPAGMVLWLPGEGTPEDIVGGNDGVPSGGVTYGTGKVGQAFSFSPENVVRVSNVTDIEVQQFSVDAWVFAEGPGFRNDNLGGIIVGKDIGNTATAPFISWNLVGPGNTGLFHVDLGFTDGSFSGLLPSTNSFSFNAWHHVAATWDGTDLKLYVNGQLEGTSSHSGKTIKYTGEALTVGDHNIPPARRAYDGLIDEVEVFNRALTISEIQSIYSAGSAGKCQQSPNSPPEVDTDTDPVEVDEGQTANNTGTVSDPDGDAVTLTASVGTVVNNNDGTWSWSLGTSDGPAESQTVTMDADDGNGGTAQTSFDLTVHNVAPTVTAVAVPGTPVAIGDQPISVSGTFSDPAGTADETYTCTVDYGDGAGPQNGTVAGTTCTGSDQTYAEAGIYTVTVAVTDKDGGTGTLTSEAFIVIYDPSGGFVTGGGWIDSPPGAYVPDPDLAGKANFGFVSKYKKGAAVPSGNTEFQFKAGDLNFHSTSYQFLVITMGGTNAQFKGSGTINGALAPNGTEYRFMIWARDDSPDTFRIRIWYEDGGGIDVYDNGFNQPIGGGAIVIHTK